jgi:hypothetical protein
VGRRAGGETGGACLRSWAGVKPRDNAIDRNGRGGRDVLHVGLGQAPLPRVPHPKGPHALGERPFDARALRRALDALLPGRPGSGGGKHLIRGLGRQPQLAALLLGLRA